MAAWKKWLVWNGSHWDVDEGNSILQVIFFLRTDMKDFFLDKD